ncbi:AAA family ATPase [Amycolatopsis sp. NPDC051371]|uniref:AAA family ATPase n=1 Tax=Amycolatopsis sp. NPDC051371 TaxID=3155800 RepID=UPI003429675C
MTLHWPCTSSSTPLPSAERGTCTPRSPTSRPPVTATPKSLCRAILDFYGADHHVRTTLPQLTRTVRASLHDHGTRVLLLDDITRLKMHRADDQDTLDLMRAFMSMNTTLVLIGVGLPGSGLLREGRHDPRTSQWIFPPPRGSHAGDDPSTQTERRFDLVHLDPLSSAREQKPPRTPLPLSPHLPDHAPDRLFRPTRSVGLRWSVVHLRQASSRRCQ